MNGTPKFIRYRDEDLPEAHHVYGKVLNANLHSDGSYTLKIRSVTPIKGYYGKTLNWNIRWPNDCIKEVSKAEHAAEVVMNS